MRDGIILGATVGFGFSAFESAGYALTSLFTTRGSSLTDLVTTELLRGLLAPVGHGLWTAILGGLLFAWSTREHFVLSLRLALAFLGVALLHALWDSMSAIALVITLVLAGQVAQFDPRGLVVPPADVATVYTVTTWTGMGVIALIGVLWLLVLLRRARREPREPHWTYRVPATRAPATGRY